MIISLILSFLILVGVVLYGLRKPIQLAQPELDKVCYIYKNRQQKVLYKRYFVVENSPKSKNFTTRVVEVDSPTVMRNMTFSEFNKFYKNNPSRRVKYTSKNINKDGLLKFSDGHYEKYNYGSEKYKNYKHWRMTVSNDPRVYYFQTN
ncbi:hypothetical protein G5T19_07890 [Lactobacillus reuteri]|nr:hypothetical protein [Limosilactobacillus reuteri]